MSQYEMEFDGPGFQPITVDVPDWANWVAQDDGGEWCFYENEPRQSLYGAYWCEVGPEVRYACIAPRPSDWTQECYEIEREGDEARGETAMETTRSILNNYITACVERDAFREEARLLRAENERLKQEVVALGQSKLEMLQTMSKAVAILTT